MQIVTKLKPIFTARKSSRVPCSYCSRFLFLYLIDCLLKQMQKLTCFLAIHLHMMKL